MLREKEQELDEHPAAPGVSELTVRVVQRVETRAPISRPVRAPLTLTLSGRPVGGLEARHAEPGLVRSGQGTDANPDRHNSALKEVMAAPQDVKLLPRVE